MLQEGDLQNRRQKRHRQQLHCMVRMKVQEILQSVHGRML